MVDDQTDCLTKADLVDAIYDNLPFDKQKATQMKYCTDNGAMIAYAGALRLQAGQTEPPEIQPKPRWSLEELNAI